MRRVQGTYCGWHDQEYCTDRVYLTQYIDRDPRTELLKLHKVESCEVGVLEIMLCNSTALVKEHDVHNVKDQLHS